MNKQEDKNLTKDLNKNPPHEPETTKTGQRHGGIDKNGQKEKDQNLPSNSEL